jgi:hypothetical protein
MNPETEYTLELLSNCGIDMYDLLVGEGGEVLADFEEFAWTGGIAILPQIVEDLAQHLSNWTEYRFFSLPREFDNTHSARIRNIFFDQIDFVKIVSAFMAEWRN